MQISGSNHYQDGTKTDGFKPYNLTPTSAAGLFKFDHTPALLSGPRKNENFLSCYVLWADSDDGYTIAEFQQQFELYHYVLYTSRNHNKEKKGKTCERFHVLFPQKTPYTDPVALARDIDLLVSQNAWADKGAKGATRLLFGNKEAQVIWHEGIPYRPQSETFEDDLPTQGPTTTKKTNTPKINGRPATTLDTWSNTKEEKILSALQTAADSGRFSNYDDWIKLGMALKTEGYSLADWLTLSNADQDKAEAEYKWETFTPTSITGGTLLHIAREVHPELLQKGSLPPSPKPRVSRPTTDTGFSTQEPTHLNTTISQERREKVWEEITILIDGKSGPVRKLAPDWMVRVVDSDAEIQNCVKFDYTIGGKAYTYANTTLLKTALLKRLRTYGIPEDALNDVALTRILEDVEYRNRFYNHILAFVQALANHHPAQADDETLLDQFIDIMTFQSPQDHEDHTHQQAREMYRETFHIFFLRMHVHILGTGMAEDGQYTGLIANDIVPILVGDQNLGKTTFCQWLACNREDFYVDLGSGGKGNFGTADTVRQVRGMMIAELGEMKVMKNHDNIEPVKSFVSKTKYELDHKYVEHSRPLPATVSYVGTSNNEEFLSDTTGNRRFFPIRLAKIDKKRMAASKTLIERLHAHYHRQAYEITRKPQGTWWDHYTPSQALRQFMDGKREDASIQYSDYSAVIEVVEKEYSIEVQKERRTNAAHAILTCDIERLVKEKFKLSFVGPQTIGKAMRELGYTYTVRKIDGSSRKIWVKKL